MPYASREAEYWYNVMPQAEMPVAGDIDHHFDVDRVGAFVTSAAKRGRAALKQATEEALLEDPSLFRDLRQLLGISDKRAYLELSYSASRIRHPRDDCGLCGCQPWTMARHPLTFFLRLIESGDDHAMKEATASLLAGYLMESGLADAAAGFEGLSTRQLATIYRTLVVPRETQQKAAKRRGHGGEGALAEVLHKCGVTILPADKHTNPMGAQDPNLDRATLNVARKVRGRTYSFDILVMDGSTVRAAVQSLIHTSDPGQYGVNKSNETVEVAARFARVNVKRKTPIELWGLIDGVGFSENKADTINKMLRCFDTFVQLNTLYKAPLRLHQLELCNVAAIRFAKTYTDEDVEAISGLYVPKEVRVLRGGDTRPSGTRSILAGRATVYLSGEGPVRRVAKA